MRPAREGAQSGYDADIMAVDGVAIADVEAIHRVRAVYVRGTNVEGL